MKLEIYINFLSALPRGDETMLHSVHIVVIWRMAISDIPVSIYVLSKKPRQTMRLEIVESLPKKILFYLRNLGNFLDLILTRPLS